MSIAEQSAGRAEIVSRALHRAMADRDGLLARLPVGVYSCDADGVIVQYNDTVAALWGRSPQLNDPNFRFCGADRTFTTRGEPIAFEDSALGRVILTGAPVRNVEMVIQRPDGSRVTVLANADPLFDETGGLVGGVNCVQDITALKDVEQRARRGARAFREIIDALPAAIYTTDAEGKITFFNKSAVDLWGRTPELNADMWCGSYKLLTADGVPLPHDQCPMARALQEGKPIRNVEAIVERPDGSRVPCMPYPTPFIDVSGALLGAINMMVDISPAKEAEARQNVMIDELNHRVKNTLATVQAIALQTFRAGDTPHADVDAFLTRLMALSKTHDHLTREQWQSADLGALLGDVLEPLRDSARDRIHIDAPGQVRLSSRAALTLGVTLNELATNAMKYGSMSVEDGRLDVCYKLADGNLTIAWRESGGPRVGPVTRRGFGTRMIERGLSSELDGRADIRFVATGLECDLLVPLSALA